jgi:hypothetical protein
MGRSAFEVSARSMVCAAPNPNNQSCAPALPVEAAAGQHRGGRAAHAAGGASDKNLAVSGAKTSSFELVNRTCGGEPGGSYGHRFTTRQRARLRYDPRQRDARMGGEPAVVGDAQVVAMNDDVRADRRSARGGVGHDAG